MSTFNLDWQVDTSQIDKLVNQLQATKDKAEAATKALDSVTGGVKKTTAATHEFSLANAGVVRELSVMFGEALRGNWNRLEGSMTVLANRTGLLAMAFSPMGALIGATAGAVGLLAIAAAKGAAEQQHLATALALTGNAAGSTAANLHEAAVAAGLAAGNLAGAKEAMAKLAESGRFSETQMQSFSTTAAEMSRITGESVDKIAQKFIRLADEPAKASLELNKQYHYLTAAVYEQITALERQGRAAEAAALAEQTYSDAMKKRSDEIVQNLGYMSRAANATGQFFSGMWDKVMGIGRKESLGDQLKNAQDQVDALSKKVAGGHGDANTQARLEAAKQNMATLEAAVHEERMTAARKADKQAVEDGKTNAAAWWESHRREFMSKAEIAREEEARIIREGQTAGKTQAEIDQALAGYRSKHKTHADNSGNNQEITALRGKIEQEKIAYDLYLTQQETALAKGQITQEGFERRKEAAYVKELTADMNYAEQAAAIAAKKGKNFEAEHQHWVNEQQKFAAQIELEHAKEQKAEADHVEKVRKINEASLQAAENFNAQRKALLEKSNRQMTMTANEKADADAREAIELKYQALITAEIQKLKDLHATTDDVSKAVDALNKKRQEALDTEQSEMQQRLKLQGDWTTGATQALKEYQENAQNVAARTKQAFTSAFASMENALVNFATTGKFNFSDLAKSILSDIIRMEARAAESKILSYLGGAFGYGSGSAVQMGTATGADLAVAYASGGVFGNGVPGMYANGTVVNGPRFFANGAGLMGEAGPEAIMPLKRGADGRLGVATSGGAGGGVVVQAPVYVTVQGGKDAKETGDAVGTAAAQKLMTAIADARIANATRVGGILNR